MKHFVLVSDDGTRQKLRVRSIVWSPRQHPNEQPPCVWCKRCNSKPILDICQSGFFHDFYQTLCYCENCGRVTCLQYRVTLENEPQHHDSAIFAAAEKASPELATVSNNRNK